MKPLIVGELNPYGANPRFVLYPLPRGASGDRLCKILGMTPAAYLRNFDRANLCTGKWSWMAAYDVARGICLDKRPVVILLGRKVAEAFRLDSFEPFTEYMGEFSIFILLPHPSARCLLWNDPQNVEKARKIVREALA